jgi:hypothetical protein
MRRATVAALERGAEDIYNIADDEPAQVSEWLPALAAAIGARPPYRIPAWMGPLAIGEPGVVIMNELRGVSNAKARIGMEAGLVKLETGVPEGTGRLKSRLYGARA